MNYNMPKTQNIYDKFVPVEKEKEYILTDSCYFIANPPSTYNPYDSKRTPHGIQLVDVETGTIVNLLSGSIIKVIKSKQKPK